MPSYRASAHKLAFRAAAAATVSDIIVIAIV
jgi:hypothetical protein